MHRTISIRVPKDVFERLESEARDHRVSISTIVRASILKADSNKLPQEKLNFCLPDSEKPTPLSFQTEQILVEVLWLLREFIFEKNGQILKRVDERMKNHFGKERQKIL